MLTFFSGAGAAQAAHSGYLFLQLNGDDVAGEPRAAAAGSKELTDSIECVALEIGAARVNGGAMVLEPLTCLKVHDKASPLLAQGIGHNATAEGTIMLFRKNAMTGVTAHYATIAFVGRISQLQQVIPSTLDPANASSPILERVSFIPASVTWTHEGGGATYTYP